MRDIFAVLTGDFVESRRLSDEQLDRVRGCLSAAASEVKGWKRGLVLGVPDFFRGDAWQMLLAEPNSALRVAVFLRASVLIDDLADTRVAIGLGTVDRVERKRISMSTGQAFTLSGRDLDGLSKHFRMSIALPEEMGILADWLPVVARLCDTIIGHWTSRQAEIVRFALAPDEPTHAEIAGRLDPPISQQTVTRALSGADWQGIRLAVKRFEAVDWSEIRRRQTIDTAD